MKGIRSLSCLAAAVAALMVAASPAAGAKVPPSAPASAAGVTEYQVVAKEIDSLAQSSDGSIFYIGGYGSPEAPERILGQVGPGGPVGESGLSKYSPDWLTGGSDGAIWLPSVHDNGQFLEFSLSRRGPEGAVTVVPGTVGTEAVASAAGGGVWFIQNEPGPNWYWAESQWKIGHVTAAGAVTSFPFAEREAGLSAIVEGHEGDAWFTEYFAGKIGRITPTGELTEFTLPAGSRPGRITVDDEGNIWFSESRAGKIGRITPEGKITEFSLPDGTVPTAIAVGADGRIWFDEALSSEVNVDTGKLGRITPTGRFTQINLPDRESQPVDLIAGSEGDIWYAAMGENTFCGGGGSCLLWRPKNQAIVGQITPTRLRSVTATGSGTIGGRGVRVALACEGGDAWNHCRGRIVVKLGRKKVATAKYSLEADQVADVLVPAMHGSKSLLDGANGKRALVSLLAGSGSGSRREILLKRGGR